MGDKKQDEATNSPQVETELSELLDSALQDFKKDSATEGPTEAPSSDPAEGAVSDEWTDDFIRQAASQFESNLASFLGTNSDGSQLTPDQMQQKFQQMSEAAKQVLETPDITNNSNDFAAAISQTIQGLSAGAEGLQNPFTEQDLANLFGGQGDQNAFVPFMQGMMQSLLSKDVLYPSLKDILDKFPEWLRTKKDSLTPEDISRYAEQQKLMENVCSELENEKETDTDVQKKERFEKVLGLMQKLQDYGQPPADLVGDVGPPLPIDLQNNADPNQCSVM